MSGVFVRFSYRSDCVILHAQVALATLTTNVLAVQMAIVFLHTQVTLVFVYVTEMAHMLILCTSNQVEIPVSPFALIFLLKPLEIMSHVTVLPNAQTTLMRILMCIVAGLTVLKHLLWQVNFYSKINLTGDVYQTAPLLHHMATQKIMQIASAMPFVLTEQTLQVIPQITTQ